MSGYSDTPSMDEILMRIKHALADRETRVKAEEAAACREAKGRRDVEVSESADFGDEYLVRPSSSARVAASHKGDDPSAHGTAAAGVVVLTPAMKVKRTAHLDGVDLAKLAEAVAFKMGRELGIPYLTPKIEKWIVENFSDIVKEVRK